MDDLLFPYKKLFFAEGFVTGISNDIQIGSEWSFFQSARKGPVELLGVVCPELGYEKHFKTGNICGVTLRPRETSKGEKMHQYNRGKKYP